MKCKFEHDEDCCNCGSPQYMAKCKPLICGCAVPMTNADRIRAMRDEEIAEWVCENGAIKTPCDIICGGYCKALATFDKSSMDVCKEIVMKWLQQPAEEEEHDR